MCSFDTLMKKKKKTGIAYIVYHFFLQHLNLVETFCLYRITLISDFVLLLTTIAKVLFLKGRLNARLCLHTILNFSDIFLVSKILSVKLFGS